MERETQQQTLSIRISAEVRELLERARQALSTARRETVSISDAAKALLESARNDRLDFRFEVTELQQSPTASFIAIRRKWEHRHPFSRAEWIFLAYYIQIACQHLSEKPSPPDSGHLIVVLEAFLAVRALRTERSIGLDCSYLESLGLPDSRSNERLYDPELVPQVVGGLIRDLREPSNHRRPALAGRALFVALRDETLQDVIALNRVLTPFGAPLLSLGARGHWIQERCSLQTCGRRPSYLTSLPLATGDRCQLNQSVTTDGELQLELVMRSRSIIYSIGPYPEIREFTAMIQTLEPGGTWDGMHFHASSEPAAVCQTMRVTFRRHSDGIQFRFSDEEWHELKILFASALAGPGMQSILAELSSAYGELYVTSKELSRSDFIR